MRVEQIGAATLYCGDCREVLPTLPRPAAIISDPPYGQSHNTNVRGLGGSRTYGARLNGVGERVIAHRRRTATGIHTSGLATEWPEIIHGDTEPFDPSPWLPAADIVLLWGAHRFADRLPPGGWLVWDKVPTGKIRDQGDGEAAWINQDRPMRLFRLLWDGVCVGAAARQEVTAGQSRVHPTQKPVVLMEWCIEQARVPLGGTIADPFMGAGATGIAALKRGHPFVGCEIDPRYFETACRRIEQAQRQADLFVQQPTPDLEAAYQRSLFNEAAE